jgi:hypothetical protein
LRFLQGLLGGLGGAAAMLVLGAARVHDASAWPFLLFFPLLLAVVVLHEAGHLVGAACAGARILGASVGPLHVERRRRGVRIRWRSGRRGTAGAAIAIPDFSRPVRRQMLLYVAAGPLANLLAAAILVPLAWPVPQQAQTLAQAAGLAFGVLNAAIGIANLVPRRRFTASDGWLLVHWWRQDAEVEAARRVLQAVDQSLRGMPASDVPPDQLAWFESRGEIGMRFFGRYIALRAAQQRGDDEAFACVLARCEQELARVDAATYAQLRPTWACFQIEQAFERARRGQPGPSLVDAALLRAVQPYLRHRLAAAEAKARGDVAACLREIGKAERDLGGVLDAAARKAEFALLDGLRPAP